MLLNNMRVNSVVKTVLVIDRLLVNFLINILRKKAVIAIQTIVACRFFRTLRTLIELPVLSDRFLAHRADFWEFVTLLFALLIRSAFNGSKFVAIPAHE
jgi:hypothetical protein